MDLKSQYEEVLAQMPREKLVEMFREANSYDSSFEEFYTFDFEDAAEYAESAYEFGRSIVYGEVTNVMEQVRYNAYMNLENVSDYELEKEAHDRIDELAAWLEDNPWCIDVPPEVEAVMKQADEEGE